jgi:hypothetical protein
MRARDSHTQRGRAGGDDATQRNALKAQVPRVLFGLGTRRTLTTSGTDGRSDGKRGTHQFCPGPRFEENLRVPVLTLSHSLPVGVWTSVGRVSLFKTHRVRVSGPFSHTWPSSLFLRKRLFNRPGEGFLKLTKKIQPCFKVPVLKQFIPAGSQTQFLENGYQIFCFSKILIFFTKKI